MGNYNFKMMTTVKVDFIATEETRICQFAQQVFVDNLTEIISFFRMLLSHILLNTNAVRLLSRWMLQEILDNNLVRWNSYYKR